MPKVMLVLGTIQAMVPGSLYDLMQDYKEIPLKRSLHFVPFRSGNNAIPVWNDFTAER